LAIENPQGVNMKKITLSLIFLFCVLLLSEQTGYAQTNDNSPRSEQVMNALLNEVRLLREDLRRLTTSTYRAHAMIERLKLQQDQVNRINNDLIATRAELAAVRSGRVQLKEKIGITQQRVDNGTSPGTELNGLKAMVTELDQREPDLVLKEAQVNAQLNLERTNLEELQKRLDAIDVELQSISKEEKRKP
jgi:hypothetical protein